MYNELRKSLQIYIITVIQQHTLRRYQIEDALECRKQATCGKLTVLPQRQDVSD